MKYTAENILDGQIVSDFGNLTAFCESTGISKQTVIDILQGGVGNAKAADLFAVCRALDLDAEQLVLDRLRICSYEERQQAWADYRAKINGGTV